MVGGLVTRLDDDKGTTQTHVSTGWLELSTQDLHEGRFTATIRANEAIAITATELNGDIFKQGFCPKLHGDIRC